MRTERVDQSAARPSAVSWEVGAPVQKVLSPKTALRPGWVDSPAQLPVYLNLVYLPRGSSAY